MAESGSGASNSYFSEHFGVTDELLQRVIGAGLDRGGTYAEVFLQHKAARFVTFEDGDVNSAYVQVDLGAGVRVLAGDQTGYAYTERLTEGNLLDAARTAASIAQGGTTTAPQRLGSGSWERPVPLLYEQEWLWQDQSPAELIGIAQQVGEKVAAGDPAVVKANARLLSSDETVLVDNSDGILAQDSRPMSYLVASCVAERDGRRETNSYNRSARRGRDFYADSVIDEIAAEAVRRSLVLFDAGSPPAGEMPVVLAPATSGILLHEALGHGFEADFNRKGRSIFSTMMGQQICPDFVTIVDTGLVPEARGAIHVDDEGTPAGRTVLVEQGKLVSYMHDRISAAHYDVECTGNGRRQDFRHPPLPRMRVTVMETGPHDPEEIIKSVDKGLYVHDFGNGEVAIGAGDYSFYVKTGYLIEDGKLTRPVKDANLIGNGPDSLAKVVMVGNDSEIDGGTWTCGKDGQGVPVGLGLPTIKVSAISVGGVSA